MTKCLDVKYNSEELCCCNSNRSSSMTAELNALKNLLVMGERGQSVGIQRGENHKDMKDRKSECCRLMHNENYIQMLCAT